MKRMIEIDVPISPSELAEEFCDMDGDEQAEFFGAVWRIAKGWTGAGWCQQSCNIVGCSDRDAIEAIRTLASHLSAEHVEWIVAASKDG